MKTFWMVSITVVLLLGCSMFKTWKAIPPPGGCEQCHRVPISSDWVVTYRPVMLNDETGKNPWQQPESMLPESPPSDLQQQKITEQRCFRCHKSPDKVHLQYKGRYHH